MLVLHSLLEGIGSKLARQRVNVLGKERSKFSVSLSLHTRVLAKVEIVLAFFSVSVEQ